ncbi:MAG: Gfo/Idh/MocA family oxidoreductase [Akkermansiaceae bacterium]|nr:Gfo/Idh/MocA family oxidoreductase [Akkermansiaceae bacterium]MCP5545379.1 Gfo/Idh/MocA family oxidoreductase [Akkermansiaceae bacterium]MCP5548048.1 Gfo/Idh/MocA family oxidoreductase [Akkermansiaceae bacterium]
MNLLLPRRGFLTMSAGALASWVAGPGAFAAEAGERKRVGLIGCGWYGKCDLLRLLQVAPVEVVALCDVDRTMLEGAADLIAGRQVSRKRPRTHADFRKMLAEKDLDLVLIATPDHWHALPAIAAMEAGADLYLQKPISVDVLEGATILSTARRLGRVVQVGTQRRSTPHLIEAKERYIDTGALGTIGHVEMCSYYHMRVRGNPPDEEPPAGLDWDFWCGPAPFRPFNRAIHPRGWRSFREYGNGILGDMCIHMLDTVRWMLDLGWPERIQSTAGSIIDPDSIANVPDTQHAVFDFGDLAAVWTHRTWGTTPDRDFPWAAVIHGDKGTLKLSVQRYEFVPFGKGETVRREVTMELDKYPEDADEKTLEKHVAPAIRGHMRNWLEAVATRGKPIADVEQGHISSASCILANIAADVLRTLAWDPETQSVRDDEAASALLARAYREPWKHPAD